MELSHVVGADKPESALLMLHGYDSNGADMLSFGRQLSAFLPHTLFVAPDAPDSIGPDAYVWYDLFAEDGEVSPLAQEKYCRQLQDICLKKSLFINELIDKIKVKYLLKNHQIGLLGFSQGGLLALVTGLTLAPPLACVVASSSIPLVDGGPVDIDQEKVAVAGLLEAHDAYIG